MRQKDLLRLPLGKYKLTDGIYYYTLEKFISHSGSIMYSIAETQSRNRLTLFEDIDDVFEHTHKYKRKILTACVAVGGLYVHSNRVYSTIWDLKILPKSTYKEFLSSINVKSESWAS